MLNEKQNEDQRTVQEVMDRLEGLDPNGFYQCTCGFKTWGLQAIYWHTDHYQGWGPRTPDIIQRPTRVFHFPKKLGEKNETNTKSI